MNTTNIINIDRGDKFVGSWGYDQTQYSIYNVVDIKGKFVFLEGLNGWSNLDARDLAVGSTVKIYEQKRWDNLTTEEQQDWSGRGFDRYGYERHFREQAIEQAEERTITKMNRVNGESWTYKWVLDDGSEYDSTDDWKTRKEVTIVNGRTRKLLQMASWSEGKPYVKIDQTITAYLDKDFNRNQNKYHEQNEYTAYNGR